MAVKKKKMKNWTRKKIQENYDFDLLPKNEIMRSRRSSSSSSCSVGVDRISELHDDLKKSVLSLLTPREATVAATLSSSWRHLDVDADADVVSIEFPYPSYNAYARPSVDKERFLEYMNAAALEYSKTKTKTKTKGKFIRLKFKFDLSCYNRYNFNLTDWFKSAAILMSSSSSSMDIHVIFAEADYDHDYSYYYGNQRDHQCPNPLKIFVEAEEWRHKLREVSLSGNRLHSSDIDLLLSKLVALERLSIEFEPQDYFYIGRPGIKTKLKHLKLLTPTFSIRYFRVFISHLDNLVSLTYNGLRTTDLHHVPKFVDATIHSGTRNIRDIVPSFAAHLLRLRLYFTLVNHQMVLNYRSYGHFTNLKHLELNVEIDSEINIQYLCPLIETFPCIHQLKVKFLWSCDPACEQKRSHDVQGDPIPMMNRMSEMAQLEVVRMSGCVGSVSELEFALYVINNASSLKELVLQRQERNHPIQSRQMDRAFQHLLSVAPSHVDLILL